MTIPAQNKAEQDFSHDALVAKFRAVEPFKTVAGVAYQNFDGFDDVAQLALDAGVDFGDIFLALAAATLLTNYNA